ncbi:ABC transporter permease [Micromonospora sp. WMMD1102]|uniref:ABC transporter permease n=1 Tax=Micromonospora sp. WMMD1102 TaxID=3016105 RepID=UPI002414FF96|nr:ABC transporter permease [Micromonospora sp. WMMD1102]MDG4788079.1 ABC transporter permease [Micromonospora sp. WMMD1102]
MTAPASAYPRTVDDLMPKAREVPVRDGELVPSVRRLMSRLNIGQEKAKEIRTRLIEEGAQREARPEPVDAGRLLQLLDERAEATGTTPTADELVSEYGVTQEQASLLAELVRVGVERKSNGQPAVYPTWWAGGPETSVAPERTDEPAPDTDDTASEPTPAPEPVTLPAVPAVETPEQPRVDTDTDDTAAPAKGKPVAVWPVLPLALPAFVALWAGWVDLGRLTGFGPVNLLPGIVDPGKWATIDSSITLPIGMETYAAYALYVWLSGRVPQRARRFAMWSAITSLVVGALGQVAYHLLIEAGATSAPWQITTAVSCLPVAVLGMGAALAHLVRAGEQR